MKPHHAPKDAKYLQRYGPKQKVLPAIMTDGYGYLVLICAYLSKVDRAGTVIAYYGSPRV